MIDIDLKFLVLINDNFRLHNGLVFVEVFLLECNGCYFDKWNIYYHLKVIV